MHLIVNLNELPYEIQVRTELQQMWAEFSEKLADRFGHQIKYGEGHPQIRESLLNYSETIASFEEFEAEIEERQEKGYNPPQALLDQLAALKKSLRVLPETIESTLGREL